ncbi:MAG: short-chain dehydrogenase/reductase, partial [bacterium]|nr:short-chain dehydrogenase/reductase [bacterium]
FGIYCASKYAIETITESYKYELFDFGVDSVIVEPGPFKTDLIYRSSPRPDDKSTINEYGEASQIAEQILDSFDEGYKSKDALPPEVVAEKISELIKMKHGERPLRSIVATADFGVSQVNNAVGSVQNSLIENLGMAHTL